MGIYAKKSIKSDADTGLNVPRHIAIIMDGNGRWAEKRSLPRSFGHNAGAENLRRILSECKRLGVSYLTVYAFSTENWKRPKDEVSEIMRLLYKFMNEIIERLDREEFRVRIFGDLDPLSDELKKIIGEAQTKSEKYDRFNLNICLNYGGKDEIVRAVRQIISDGLNPDEVDESAIARRLYSRDVPDPDLVIRPGGEVRTSNFLMWQSAYSELFFTDVLWPDFSEKDLRRAIAEFTKRNRRFGGQ